MKRALFVAMFLSLCGSATAQQIRTVQPRPLSQAIDVDRGNVRGGTIQLPLITWGGDIATVYADTLGIFEDEGLDVELFLENNFPNQVEGLISGRTPFLRGTMGMVNAAAEAAEEHGIEIAVIYQMTWSNGGDTMVTRPSVRTPSDLRGKTIALQLYGPHMDYAANLLSSSQVPLDSVTFRWFEELTLPTFNTNAVIDPVTAFQADDSIDAVMAIIPDALLLTSGGEVGTGAEGSVAGSRVLLSTRTANRVIADVYAVRTDYLDANRDRVQRLVHALMQAEEELQRLIENQDQRQTDYRQLLTRAATILLDSPQATADAEALLGDAEFVGHRGNVQFFTGRGTTRSLDTLNREIQTSFRGMNLMASTVALTAAGWDYAALGRGLANAGTVAAPAPAFDENRVAAAVEERIAAELDTWEEEGTLFLVEINFAPNQSDFPAAQYTDDFRQALEISQTYGGSLIIIEGHSDPLGILRARQDGERSQVLSEMEQVAKNLSFSRATAVRRSFLEYARSNDFPLDESRFVPVGLGVDTPKFSPPRTEEEWAANRRVVFRIKQVEAELERFIPLN